VRPCPVLGKTTQLGLTPSRMGRTWGSWVLYIVQRRTDAVAKKINKNGF
jgi:hypothetical protein